MPIHDDLGTRMKEYYEAIPKTKLMRRTPVALRIDGKAFHTFTRGFQKPFDTIMIQAMQLTMKYLCENIQGCVFGYTQSDEITLILVDYKKLNSSAWFDYEVQKICSIAASMATMKFNKEFGNLVVAHKIKMDIVAKMGNDELIANSEKYISTLDRAIAQGAMFDCRCFNIPKEEVTNLVYWRQLDASRNSVEMVGRAYFSDKELFKKSVSNIQDMLIEKYGINWNNFPTEQKRGSSCIYSGEEWIVDHEMPILKGDDRQYLEQYIYYDEEKQ